MQRPLIASTVSVLLLVIYQLSAGCARAPERATETEPGAETARSPHAPSPADPWAIVHEGAVPADETVYWQATTPPRSVVRWPLTLAGATGADGEVVIVRVVIDRHGRIAKMQILRGPEIDELEPALVESLRRWRFEPATVRGEPVPVYMNLTIPITGTEPRPSVVAGRADPEQP